ncbi:hypothetical protein FSP39_022098 [Pinctada imbricata]|uniref:Uncharacterized protein n=1 Tax=Pinctada imbricata TaxID=66713 RepID=A0AA88Y5V6_PINIB|nr:hypothetical protein FSP39_022098 [Pinctada imbricata]
MNLFLFIACLVQVYDVTYGVSVMTFNADLSPTTCRIDSQSKVHPGTCEFESRRDRLIEKLNKDSFFSDAICLQGIWYEKDAVEIIDKLQKSGQYEYSYSFLHDQQQGDIDTKAKYPPPCHNDTENIRLLQFCNDISCYSDPRRYRLFQCIEDECKMDRLMEKMSESCLGCLYHGTVNDNFDECTMSQYAFNPTGLLFLSKRPMSNIRRGFYHDVEQMKERIHGQDYTYYKSRELIQRGYLDVNVNGIGRVVCTQLTEKLGDLYIDLHPDFTSYEEKNKFEMKQLAIMLKDEKKAIVLADMSSTPVITKLGGKLGFQFQDHFNTYFGGWEDPISSSYFHHDPHCTVCCGNDFVRKEGICGKSGGVGYMMDHVLLKGYHVKDRNIPAPDVSKREMEQYLTPS